MKREDRQPIWTRPHYSHGQLLLEDDFRAEQEFHVQGRRRHNLLLHGWGVVSGMRVRRDGQSTVVVEPGSAIDPSGQEIILSRGERVDLSAFKAKDQVRIVLSYEESTNEPDPSTSEETSRLMGYPMLDARAEDVGDAGLVVATVQLDDGGAVSSDGISYRDTRYAGASYRPRRKRSTRPSRQESTP